MPAIDPCIFRSYDIRGKAHEQLTTEACELIARGFGSVLREIYKLDHPTVAVGRDARTHSPEFEAAVIGGLASAGCRVLTIGETPSPVNYFTICTAVLDGGIQVTASHNAPEDNGLKLQVREADAFAGEDLQKLRQRIEKKKFLKGKGTVEPFDGITPYIEYLAEKFAGIGTDLHAAVDCGNGVTGPVYTEVLRRAGCTLTELYTEPDGSFPHHLADPSKWETLKDLQQKVLEIKADCGLAFDGDGDRVGLLDEEGRVRTADEILLLLAQDHLKRHPGAPVVFTVSNSSTLEAEIARWGGKPVMTKVGHSHVEHAMREHRALLGGEQSGHFFCGEDYFPYDDALAAALRILRILAEAGAPASQLFHEFPKVYQAPEQRPRCPDEHKARVVENVTKHFAALYPVNDLDGARIDFGDGAWTTVRYSNTSPCLSICMEARSPEKLAEIDRIILEHLKAYPEVEL